MELAVLRLVREMSDDSIARTAGQIYYDFALREPSVLVGTAYEIGKKIRKTLLDGDKWAGKWGDVVSRYIDESLVGHSPNALVVGVIRMAAIHAYIQESSKAA